MESEELIICKQVFKLGESGIVKLGVGRLPSDTRLYIQAHLYRGPKPGPTTLLLAGVHGDEINGVEIVRRVIANDMVKDIKKGTIIVIPLLNVYGFINFNRYVPDGKDVNRSFPGTKSGSLASRIANTLTKHILPNVDYIFDFHTGGDSRYNYPQIRYTRTDAKARELAQKFKPPFIIESGNIPKSLRKIAKEKDIPMLIYEGGESVRLNHSTIDMALQGLKRSLVFLGYLRQEKQINKPIYKTVNILNTSWLRASFSGIFLWTLKSGSKVSKGEILGTINDPNGQKSVNVLATKNGYIIGHNNASVVNQGDALFHIGYET